MLREYNDSTGRKWLVWDVNPEAPTRESRGSDPGAYPQREMDGGWLCFESQGEKRRVAPIPDGWAHWSARELEALCDSAPRSGARPSRGVDVTAGEDGDAARS